MSKIDKEERKDSSPIKQLSKDDLDSSDKPENLFLHDEIDVFIEEDTQRQVFTLEGITEDDIILIKLCGKNFFSILLQEF